VFLLSITVACFVPIAVKTTLGLQPHFGVHPYAMSKRPLIIEVNVKPNARVSQLRQDESGQWLAQIKSLPVDGKANAELIGLVAKHFACRRAAVSIKTGAAGRLKLVKIEAPYVLAPLG
jgi:uncharacterized protein